MTVQKRFAVGLALIPNLGARYDEERGITQRVATSGLTLTRNGRGVSSQTDNFPSMHTWSARESFLHACQANDREQYKMLTTKQLYCTVLQNVKPARLCVNTEEKNTRCASVQLHSKHHKEGFHHREGFHHKGGFPCYIFSPFAEQMTLDGRRECWWPPSKPAQPL